MIEDSKTPAPNPGPTPTGYQRTTGGKGFKWQPPTAEHLSRLLPQYEIECILGHGGMGAVYKGKQKSLDRLVAIKILPPELDDEDASYVDRFKNEAKVMAKFMHPAIVGVFDFGETSEGQLYIVMEYVDGTDVQKMIQSQGRLPPEHALAITAHVCDALRYAHEHGVIHRDIKPANILINMEGAVKVADFGLAKAEEAGASGLTKTGMAMGTPDYVAPEALVMGVNVDGRADLYAIGVMLYNMLTGNVPRGAFKPASIMIREIDPRFDAIVQKAMQMDREERYQSAAEIRSDLDVILTTPLVQAGGQSSAAIPKASIAQKPVSKGPQKPMGKSANVPVRSTAAPAGEPKSEAAAPPSKSLAWGIPTAVSAVVILGGAFYMRGKIAATPAEEPAPIAAKATASAPIKVREEPKPTPAPVAKSPSLPVSKSSEPQFPPGKWVKVFTKFEDLPADLREPDSGVKFEDGWIDLAESAKWLRFPSVLSGNYAVKARFKRKSSSLNQIIVRRQTVGGTGMYMLRFIQGTLSCLVRDSERNTETKVFEMPVQGDVKDGDEYDLEFGVVGNQLIGRFGDKVVGFAQNGLCKGGVAHIQGTEAIRDIEVINLDGLSEAGALKILGVDEKGNDLRKPTAAAATPPAPAASKASASPVSSSPPIPVSPSPDKFPPGHWVKLFTKFEDLPQELQQKQTSAKWDGWIKLEGGEHRFLLPDSIIKNYGYRARFRRGPGTGATEISHISLRVNGGANNRYQLSFNGSALSCARKDGEPYSTLFSERPSSITATGEEYMLEFVIVNSTLLVRLNETTFKKVTDNIHGEGRGSLLAHEDIRDIEVINLDGLPEAEALRIIGVDEKGNDLRALAAKQEQQMAEQAKAVDAMAAIPELKTLHEAFLKLTAERVTAPFEADVAKLNNGYLGGIDRKIAEERGKGNLDGVLALEAENKLVAAVDVAALARAWPAVAPVPPDDDQTTATLKTLRQIYRDAFAKLDATRAANLKLLTDPLDTRLKQVESTLTQANRIDHAKTVREYREGLGVAAGSPAAMESKPTASTKVTQPLSKYPKGDDRKAAEWVLEVGGTVTIGTGGGPTKEVSDPDDLPKQFSLLKVEMEFGRAEPKRPIKDLTLLAGLDELVGLRLVGKVFTDGMFDILPSLRSLEGIWLIETSHTDDVIGLLSQAKALKTLAIEQNRAFTGRRLAELTPLKLTNFGIKSTGVTSAALAVIGSWTQLTSLTLWYHSFSDDDMAALSKLPELLQLQLSNTPVTPLGLRHFSAAKNLSLLAFNAPKAAQATDFESLAAQFPKLETYRVAIENSSREDIAVLRCFKKLNTLALQRNRTTDDVVRGVLDLPNLTILRLEFGAGTNFTPAAFIDLAAHKQITAIICMEAPLITDEALMALAGMRQLQNLELRGSLKLTDAGIAAFKKRRPDVRLLR